MKKTLFLLLLGFSNIIYTQNKQEFPVLKGDLKFAHMLSISCNGTLYFLDYTEELWNNFDIHFRQPDGSWTDPVNMGVPINTSQMERFSAMSPDGKYLFFTRDTPGYDEDVYWVSTGIIGKLKAKAFQEQRLSNDNRQENPK